MQWFIFNIQLKGGKYIFINSIHNDGEGVYEIRNLRLGMLIISFNSKILS